MKKLVILLVVLIYIFYSSAEKLNKKKKNARSMGASFDGADGYIHPADIIESVHSDLPGEPQIKIRFAGTKDDDSDATISMDTESQEDDDDLPKSKTEDIHSFL